MHCGKLPVVLGVAALVAGCSSSGQRSIELMPAPAVFAGGEIDPFPEQPPLAYGNFGLLYATDRKPSADLEEWPFYLNEAGFIVRMGQARVRAGEGMSWAEVRRISLSKQRSDVYTLSLDSVEESSVLDSTYTFLTRQPEVSAAVDQTGAAFAEQVNHRLSRSGVKDVYIYVHGYRVEFDDPVLVSAELWHFLGYRGAFVSYSWPSTPRALAYMSDLETAKTMARKLRLFIDYLNAQTEVEKIHLIGFSAGSRLVVRALEQMALLHAETSDQDLREQLKIGNVIIIGGDISREGFGAALMDGLLRIPERTVVYVSSTDRALVWSRRIFRRERLGEKWDEPMPARTVEFLGANPSLEWIDVTGAAGSTTGNGHGYFRHSPWVSSDILTMLAFDLDPAQRGLVRDGTKLVWRFPDNYVEKLQLELKEYMRRER